MECKVPKLYNSIDTKFSTQHLFINLGANGRIEPKKVNVAIVRTHLACAIYEKKQMWLREPH